MTINRASQTQLSCLFFNSLANLDNKIMPAADDTKTRTKITSKWMLAKTFGLGFVSGIVFLRAVRFYQIWRLPNTTEVQSIVLPMLRANQDVRSVIGTSLRPGLMSTFAYTGGIKWRLPYVDKRSGWSSLIPFSYEPWGLRSLFQIVGENEAGFVTVETLPGGKKDLGSNIGFKLICVDFKNGQRLVLRGTADQNRTFLEYHN